MSVCCVSSKTRSQPVAAKRRQYHLSEMVTPMSTSQSTLSLEQFSAARYFTTDIGTAIGVEEETNEAGYVYPGGCYINQIDDEFLLVIGSASWMSSYLAELEQTLYNDWYLPEIQGSAS